MADEQTVTPDVGERIAQGIAEGLNRLMPRKVTIGQYDPKTAFHPNKKTAKKFANRELWQNNHRCNDATMYDSEIELANQIHRPGRYISRRVEVVIDDSDPEGKLIVYLRYNDRTKDQQLENARYWRDFGDLLKQIVMEQEVAEENENLGLTAKAKK